MEIKKMALCPHALLEEEDPWISRMFSAISAPPISSSSPFSCAHGTIKSQNSTFIKSSPHGREGKRCCCLRLRWFSRWAGTWVMSALMDFINIITSLPPPQAHLIWTASWWGWFHTHWKTILECYKHVTQWYFLASKSCPGQKTFDIFPTCCASFEPVCVWFIFLIRNNQQHCEEPVLVLWQSACCRSSDP